MQFLVDENLPGELVLMAPQGGHEAIWIRDVAPGAPDTRIVERLEQHGEILVTRDVRFANLVVSLIAVGRPLVGVVLVREQSMARIREAWAGFLREVRPFEGIAVARVGSIRYRRMLR